MSNHNSLPLDVILDAKYRPIRPDLDLFPSKIADVIVQLTRQRDELAEALRGLEFMYRRDLETHNDCFERIADRYYKDTGKLAPGKSEPMEIANSDYSERIKFYDEWMKGFITRARAALSRLGKEGG